MFPEASLQDINQAMLASWNAFLVYRQLPLKRRANFLRAIAVEIEALGDELIQVAGEESHLPEMRLRGERGRTIFQLNSYAAACEQGTWLEARIDTAIPDKTPPKPDIRKMLVPIGPVAVFGASNFPFAFSTAGGDTASALAAGCSVIVKAHPGHPRTSELMSNAIQKAAAACQLPSAIYTHVHGFEAGKLLVKHSLTKAVAFTGSLSGGKQLYDLAQQRPDPIPVFAEMSSVNPVFLLPNKLEQEAEAVATLYASSITLGVGQFCTNPGIIIGLEGAALARFTASLAAEIQKIAPATMLHAGIAQHYATKRAEVLQQPEVTTLAVSEISPNENQGIPTVSTVSGATFLANPVLHQEVFGPYSLVIRCQSAEQMEQIVTVLGGQLTSTFMANANDLSEFANLIDTVKTNCGRIILNGVPTGVEVCLSMQHGGPFPATTDARFTSVGADAIKRFARPFAYQSWPDELLPDELKNNNPLGIWRTINDELTKASVG